MVVAFAAVVAGAAGQVVVINSQKSFTLIPLRVNRQLAL